jgi:hypothetical protein
MNSKDNKTLEEWVIRIESSTKTELTRIEKQIRKILRQSIDNRKITFWMMRFPELNNETRSVYMTEDDAKK